MANRSSALIKPLAILLATLLIGVLLGATLTGALVGWRLSAVASLANEESFANQMTKVIQPHSDEQLSQIAPILLHAGGEIEAVIGESRRKYCRIIEEMTEDLTPYLSPEQVQALEERRNRFRSRLSRLPGRFNGGDNVGCANDPAGSDSE